MSDPQKLGMSQVFAELQKQGDLIVIDKEVDPETEISGVIVAMEKLEGVPPLLFTKVRGYDFKVGANLFIDRNRLCRIHIADGFCRLQQFRLGW